MADSAYDPRVLVQTHIEKGVESAKAALTALQANRFKEAGSLIVEAWSQHHEAEQWLELAAVTRLGSDQCARALAELGELIRRAERAALGGEAR
jgi:hypothetical protein